MADLSQIRVRGTLYDVKDAVARMAFGAPSVAATASAMTDQTKVYVYTGSESGYTNGSWYYYDGSSWVAGGVYNSAAVATDTSLSVSGKPADAKATGDALDDIDTDISDLKSAIDAKTGLPEGFGTALMELVNHIGMWTDGNAQRYIDNLQNTLDGGGGDVADLSYITAVYTQSGTVYDTDSLSSLRSDLVVTAHYTDSTTAVVTAYTLSGTLTAGTSTVTVSYGGKTASFTVTVVADTFPSEYQKVEWVGATITGSSAISYVDVGIHLDDKAGLEGYELNYTAMAGHPWLRYKNGSAPLVSWSGNAGCYFGAVDTVGSTDSTNDVYGWGDSGTSGTSLDRTAVPAGEVHTFRTYWNESSGITECGSYSCSREYVQGSADLNLKLGSGAWDNNNGGTFKFYGDIKIKKDGSLVRDLYPCYRKADSAIGFYDTITETFYTKTGGGANFEKGADI